MLIAANFFDHRYLQQKLIAEVIIPNMTPTSAVTYLKACLNDFKRQTSSLCYLQNYSKFYLSKHFSELIRSNPKALKHLDTELIRGIIDYSLNFVVDQRQDLEAIL